MSSNADFDAAMNRSYLHTPDEVAQILRDKREEDERRLMGLVDPDTKPDKKVAYATFDDDKPYLSVRQRVLYGALLLVIIFAAVWAVERLIFDGLPALFGDRATHQVEQPDTPSSVIEKLPELPTQESIQQQIGGYSASIVPLPAGTAPSTKSTPNQNAPSSEVIIPFGALPRLIEIDPPVQSGDGAHEHMRRLEPLHLW